MRWFAFGPLLEVAASEALVAHVIRPLPLPLPAEPISLGL